MSTLTNIYPINIDFEEFNIFRVKFKADLLEQLRKNYNKDYSFFRNGDYIYISSDAEAQLNIGEELVLLKVAENERIVSSLIKHILFRAFRRIFYDIVPLDFYPFRFLSRKEEHDLISSLLSNNLKGEVGYKRQTEIQFREIEIHNKLTHCAVFNIDYRWVFQKSCLDLHKEGFDLRNLDVVHSMPIPNLEGIIAPDETLIGTIQNSFLEGTHVSINVETNEGSVKYPAEDLFLEKTFANIENYLEFKIGARNTQEIFQKIANSKAARFNLKSLQREIQNLAETFSKIPYNNKDGFVFSISDKSISLENSFQVYEPKYIFDDDDIQKHSNPYFGITSFGPADKSYFQPKQLRILVICHSQKRESYTNFIATLEKGLPNNYDQRGNPKNNYFADGWLGKYKLHSISFDVEEIQDYRSQTYKTVINNYLRKGEKPELVILEIDKDFKKLDVVENPYYQIKAHLLSLGIPVQFVDSRTLTENKTSESFFNIISLQMYAKIGGTAWALPSRRSYDKEIVIGVGSYLERKNKFSKNDKTKIVGITTFFSGEGRYLLGNKCSDVDYDDYFNELLASLREAIENLSKEFNWKQGATILIIFHIFKPIKMVEAQVVEKLISEFTQYRIKYAFVTISEHHPFLLFDPKQRGNERSGKGEYLPKKGTNLILNGFSCLLQSRSVDDIKTKKHGVPKPLLIKIIPSENPDINFRDLNHITQQIYQFSNLSFSGFTTSKTPVTIFYSDKIASWLSKLKKIEGWKPQVVNTELKRKKWFL
jgi:hypothetical protein